MSGELKAQILDYLQSHNTMSKLVIMQNTVGPKGKHLSRGDVIEIEEPKDVYALIAAGRALDQASKKSEDQEVIKEILAEKAETAKTSKK